MGHMKQGVLYINGRYEATGLALDSVIHIVCFMHAMRPDGICKECIRDLAFEFARQNSEGDGERALMKYWASVAREAKLDGEWYAPHLLFEILGRMTGMEGLRTIIEEISQMVRYGLTFSFNEYTKYLQTRVKRFAIPLDRVEVRIIRELLERPTATFREVASRTGLSLPWVSKKIKSLRERVILRKFESVRFSRLDIDMYILLLSMRGGDYDAREALLQKCPFTYNIREVLTGEWDTLVTLAIPENVNSIRSILRALERLKKAGIENRLMEVHSSGVATNFHYYSADEGRWRIPWDLERVVLAKIYTEQLAGVFPRIDYARKYLDIEIDDTDIQILELFWKQHTTLSQIRERIEIGRQNALKRVKRLRENGIINTIWEVHNIGLNENALVAADDEDTGRTIAAWTQNLPRSIISFDEKDRLSLIVNLPIGGCCGMANALRVLPHPVKMMQLGMTRAGSWQFPTEYWDTETQSWSFPRHKMDEWFDLIDTVI